MVAVPFGFKAVADPAVIRAWVQGPPANIGKEKLKMATIMDYHDLEKRMRYLINSGYKESNAYRSLKVKLRNVKAAHRETIFSVDNNDEGNIL